MYKSSNISNLIRTFHGFTYFDYKLKLLGYALYSLSITEYNCR